MLRPQVVEDTEKQHKVELAARNGLLVSSPIRVQTFRIRTRVSGFERVYSKQEVAQYLPKRPTQFPSLAEWSQVDAPGQGRREQSKAFALPVISGASPRANASLPPRRRQATKRSKRDAKRDALQDIKLPRKPAVFTLARGSKATAGPPREVDEMYRAMGETDLLTKFKRSTNKASTRQDRQEIDDDLEAFELRVASVRLAESKKRAVEAARKAACFADSAAKSAEAEVHNAIRKQKRDRAASEAHRAMAPCQGGL